MAKNNLTENNKQEMLSTNKQTNKQTINQSSKLKLNYVYNGNSLDVLKTFPDDSIDCCVTSPPYYGLRDYGTGRWVGGDPDCKHESAKVSTRFERTMTDKSFKQTTNIGSDVKSYIKTCPICGAVREDEQIGLEETPEEYIQRLMDVFHEIKRVLKDDGTLWLNIGDSWWGSGSRGYDFTGKWSEASKVQSHNMGATDLTNVPKLVGKTDTGIKNKDMVGIPWMLAFALRKDGWYLRQDIIWHKPNPMPESVKDRCTKSHEYIFLLSKSQKYYFDYEAIQEEATGYDGRKDTLLNGSQKYSDDSYMPNQNGQTMASRGHERWKFKNLQDKGQQTHSMHERRAEGQGDTVYPVRNKRDVWSVATKPYKEAHFATFPEALIEPCILAGCPKGGVVLDPFFGSGTTGYVATKYNRNYIGIELNPKYIDIAHRRLSNVQMSLFGIL